MEKFPRFEKQQPLYIHFRSVYSQPNHRPLTNKRSWKQFSKVSLSNKFPSFGRVGEGTNESRGNKLSVETKRSSLPKEKENRNGTKRLEKLVWKIAFLSQQIVQQSRFVRHSTNKRLVGQDLFFELFLLRSSRLHARFSIHRKRITNVYKYIYIRVLPVAEIRGDSLF